MSEEKQPISRKSSSMNGDGENGKDVINNNNDDGEVTLKAKMSLVNGCTVIVGSIIGELLLLLLIDADEGMSKKNGEIS